MNEFADENEEKHAIAIGFYDGFTETDRINGLERASLNNPDVRKEIHYAKGSYVVGVVFRYILIGLSGASGLGIALKLLQVFNFLPF